MKIDMQNLLDSILESLDRIEYIKPADIPNIDLYMDQVTTFMDNKLRRTTRNPGDDKVLTKTMINNYAKNDLLPPPIKKKYSKEHVLLLIFIYYFKRILSINDIQTLFEPVTEHFFGKEGGFSLEDIYQEVFSMEKKYVKALQADVEEKFHEAGETFQDAPEENQAFLKQFSFICMLSFDVYVKKLMIEKMIDGIRESGAAGSASVNGDKKENKGKEAKGKEEKEREPRAKAKEDKERQARAKAKEE